MAQITSELQLSTFAVFHMHIADFYVAITLLCSVILIRNSAFSLSSLNILHIDSDVNNFVHLSAYIMDY